jgi:2-amino-4-hydroxy-6-hydroxymethyldihydropteridine diphosphokinase
MHNNKSVTIKHLERVSYIALGSNLGDRLANLERALKKIDKIRDIKVEKVSSIYITEPIGITKQRNFFNAVVKIKTDLKAEDLLLKLKAIEKSIGRDFNEVRWGPRIIDLDILLYDELVIKQGDVLCIPHVQLKKRRFFIEPLVEIAPDLRYPGENLMLRNLLEKPEVNSQKIRHYLSYNLTSTNWQ